MKYYKVLDRNGRSCHGGDAEWSLPQRNEDGSWVPGEWMPEVSGKLKPCKNGYHVVTLEQLPWWLGERIFEVEVGDEIVHANDKSVVRTCRLIRECTGWNERTARLFACDCAERVLPLYEAYCDDDSPRKAIEVARRYAEGKAAVEELLAACDAAWEATREAVRAIAWATSLNVSWDAAWEATREASRAIAWAASLDVSREAVREAAREAARAIAWTTTLSVSRKAAWSAAWKAALAAERQWQVARLGEILELA